MTWRAGACFVGFAVAGWIWLGWGFCWDATLTEIGDPGSAPAFPGRWVGRYVRVRATGARGSFRVSHVVMSRVYSGTYATLDEYRIHDWKELEGEGWTGWDESLPVAATVWLHEGDPSSGVYAVVAGELEQPCPTVSGRMVRPSLVFIESWSSGLDHFPGPAKLLIDTTAGRVNGVVLIGFVVAFWSAVFLGLHTAGWRRSVARHQALAGEALRARRVERADGQGPTDEGPAGRRAKE